MPPPPQPDPTDDGARNLFLDADPIDDDALTEPGGRASKPTAPRRRGRGRIVAVDRPSPIAAATSSSSRAAGFTRPTAGIARLRMPALARIRGAAVLAGRLLSRVAARPYAPLTALIALIALAGLLIALGWLGLAFTDASAARRVAEQRLAVATAMLRHDRARIDALSAQLHQAALAAGRQQPIATAAHARRPTAERTPARGRHRRH
jgi:hypothetical protein